MRIRQCINCNEEWEDNKKSTLCPSCRSAMGKRNKRKGNANELRFAKKLQKMFDTYELPYRARRTPRSGAIHEFEPGDILINAPIDSIFKKIHWENKNTASWYIEDWMEKAHEVEKEMGLNRNPVLVIRKPNMSSEFAVVDAEWLVELLIENEKLKED